MSLHPAADEWERLGDEVVVRAGQDFHLLKARAATTWLRLCAGKRVRRRDHALLSDLRARGLVEVRR